MPARGGALAVASTLALGIVPIVAFAPAANAAPAPTTLTVRTNKTSFVAGQKLSLTVHSNVAGASLTYYEVNPGKKARKILTGTTDAKGNDAVTGSVAYNATFVVRYAGDATHAAAKGQRSIKVRVLMPAKLGGGFKTSGSYRVYHASKKGVFAAGVAPKKKGTKVTFGLQVLKGKAWKTVDTRKYTLDKDSVAAGTFRGAAGHHYRIRASWAGDKLNGANHSAYKYAAFVK